nr:zinc finger BED domain-containing protein RICESLEEPER 2 [Tanacetum cinerariifolium]
MPQSEAVSATAAPEAGQAEEATTADPPTAPESHKRGRDGTDVNAPSKSLRRDHADPRPSRSSHGGKSLAAIRLGLASTAFMPEDAPTGDPESENASSHAEVGSPGSVYRPEWGVTNGSLLDTPKACQDLVDHAAPSGYFFELRHMHNEEFLGQYNINLARQVAMGSQLRLKFEQEAKLLRKSVAQVARRDQRIQARELEIKNLEARLETEAEMKKAAEDKSVGLIKELEDIRARFLDLQVSNEHFSQQVATLQEQVSREEKLKAAFEEFKRYKDERVEQRCEKLDARHGLRLAMMKCGESLEMRQAFADVAYDPEAEAKFVTALQALKDLKYPLLDQLEGLKNAPMDVVMAALYLESDIGDDAPQDIRDLRPSSSQLTIPVYPEYSEFAGFDVLAFESAISTSGRALSIKRTKLTPSSLEMCMCLKDHLYAQERKQHTFTLENTLDFEDEILDAEVQEAKALWHPVREEKSKILIMI